MQILLTEISELDRAKKELSSVVSRSIIGGFFRSNKEGKNAEAQRVNHTKVEMLLSVR